MDASPCKLKFEGLRPAAVPSDYRGNEPGPASRRLRRSTRDFSIVLSQPVFDTLYRAPDVRASPVDTTLEEVDGGRHPVGSSRKARSDD